VEGGPSLLAYPGDRVVTTDPKAGTVTVRLRDREWVVDEEHRTALDLAYAQHLYRAQGRTVAEVLVCGGGWQTDQASGYVGVTRARETSVVITDSDSLGTPPGDVPAATRALAARWAEAHPAVAATTLLDQAELAAAAPAEQEVKQESEPAPAPPEPPRDLESGWTLVDELERDRERE